MKNRTRGVRKHSLVCLLLCLILALSGCGRVESLDNSQKSAGIAPEQEYFSGGAGAQSRQKTDTDETDAESESVVNKDADVAAETAEDGTEEGQQAKADETASQDQQIQTAAQQVSKEMLVYRGKLSIDTLKFDQSVDNFKKLLDQVGGFVETENYSDDGALEGYYMMEEQDKRNTYNATVRVPSSKYDTVMNEAGSLGDLRSKSSNAENVTQQYSTYQSEIKIYEAEYQRYLKLLEKAKEDQYALQIEQKLFELQVKIADIKAGITNIETDVAYSYIDITLREVKKYQEEPEKDDTFFDRLKNTCVDSWEEFLYLLENILFMLIYTWYYIVVVIIIVFIVLHYVKKKPRSTNSKTSGDTGTSMDSDSEKTESDSTEVEQEDK